MRQDVQNRDKEGPDLIRNTSFAAIAQQSHICAIAWSSYRGSSSYGPVPLQTTAKKRRYAVRPVRSRDGCSQQQQQQQESITYLHYYATKPPLERRACVKCKEQKTKEKNRKQAVVGSCISPLLFQNSFISCVLLLCCVCVCVCSMCSMVRVETGTTTTTTTMKKQQQQQGPVLRSEDRPMVVFEDSILFLSIFDNSSKVSAIFGIRSLHYLNFLTRRLNDTAKAG